MKVRELIAELQKFPPDTDVGLYAGKCCDVMPIRQVYLHPGGAESPSVFWLTKRKSPAFPDDATACNHLRFWPALIVAGIDGCNAIRRSGSENRIAMGVRA